MGVLHARRDDGTTSALSSSGEGHLEVEVHGPRMPFGEVHVESAEPVFQGDFVYGINAVEQVATTGNAAGGAVSSAATASNNLGVCSTGTTAYAFGAIQSRKRLRYRPGQGVIARFTALFSSPVASSILVAGVGTAESGYYFGYNGTAFGILHVTGGVREIQTLTVTTASTAVNNYVVELSGTSFNVTATNNGSTVKTAYEIASGTYTGWKAFQRGSTVIFVADSARAYAGAFSLAQTGAVTPAAGSFAETKAGAASSDTWIAQTAWNGDKLDGTGASGVTLNPQFGNVFQIDIQYLGFGAVDFKVEVTTTGGNNADFVTVHTLKFPNTRTAVTASQPAFPFTMAAYSNGSTTNVSVSCGSYAGFIAGKKKLTGPRMIYDRDTTGFVGSTAATYYPLVTVRNDLTFNGRANQTVVNLLSISGSNNDATPVTIYLLRNATLLGTPNFALSSTSSCTSQDTAATTATIAAQEQIIFALKIAGGGDHVFPFSDEVTIQPGETLTVAGRAVTGTATWVTASLNTREDQ